MRILQRSGGRQCRQVLATASPMGPLFPVGSLRSIYPLVLNPFVGHSNFLLLYVPSASLGSRASVCCILQTPPEWNASARYTIPAHARRGGVLASAVASCIRSKECSALSHKKCRFVPRLGSRSPSCRLSRPRVVSLRLACQSAATSA